MCVCVRVETQRSNCGLFDPDLCVYYVLYVWFPSQSVLNDPTQYCREKRTLNHFVVHCNSKGKEKGGRNTSGRQISSVAWKSDPRQTRAAPAPNWQNPLQGNKLDFKINVPPNCNSLSVWLNSCKGQTAGHVCCIGGFCLCDFRRKMQCTKTNGV